LEASGRIDALWSASVRCRIAPSSAFRGSALAGEGEFQVDWERLGPPRASLAIGRNRLTAQGTFGSGPDRIRVALADPAPAP
ncbi:hypothetical protein, partial [Pelomicrobium sp. G1]|uniref:hypothetical protein n=1 Tax=Pelomicrobium sp. G1 TaxID=3452920 RepID=UPI003F772049